MIKSIFPLTLLGAAIIVNTGCNSNGDFKKIHGIEYKIIKDVKGPKAKMGDIIEYNCIAKIDTSEKGKGKGEFLELANTYKQGRPQPGRVDNVKESGQFQAVFPFLSVGDSAVVQISCDTILKNIPAEQMQRIPSWLKNGAGKKIVVSLSVVSIKSEEDFRKDQMAKQAEMQNEMKAKAAQQLPIDDKILQDYFAKNNIKAQKTASGLYYTIQRPGSGAQIVNGQTVSVKYTGKTLDGKVFDSNVDTSVSHHGDPLVFPVGQHQMIAGMDEGVALLKKGAKATLYMPSPLAYGPQSPSPNIAPNSILMFDVEVTDVKNTPPPPARPMPNPNGNQ